MKRVVVVTAVRAETRAVLTAIARPRRRRGDLVRRWEGVVGGGEVVVLEAGIGPVAARRAIDEAHLDCDIVISAGFAGALVAGLAPGELVVPSEVVWDDDAGSLQRYEVPAALHEAVVAALPPALRVHHAGAIFSSPVVVATPAAKMEAARRYGAVAVEMEAGALASYVRSAGVPLVMLRAILDAVDLSLESLPPELATSWSARAELLVTPAAWPLVATLRRHVGTASRALSAASTVLLPSIVSSRR